MYIYKDFFLILWWKLIAVKDCLMSVNHEYPQSSLTWDDFPGLYCSCLQLLLFCGSSCPQFCPQVAFRLRSVNLLGRGQLAEKLISVPWEELDLLSQYVLSRQLFAEFETVSPLHLRIHPDISSSHIISLFYILPVLNVCVSVCISWTFQKYYHNSLQLLISLLRAEIRNFKRFFFTDVLPKYMK